jgi:hypothetical protein
MWFSTLRLVSSRKHLTRFIPRALWNFTSFVSVSWFLQFLELRNLLRNFWKLFRDFLGWFLDACAIHSSYMTSFSVFAFSSFTQTRITLCKKWLSGGCIGRTWPTTIAQSSRCIAYTRSSGSLTLSRSRLAWHKLLLLFSFLSFTFFYSFVYRHSLEDSIVKRMHTSFRTIYFRHVVYLNKFGSTELRSIPLNVLVDLVNVSDLLFTCQIF